MKVAIIGSGYVGLTTGTCLADLGHDIVCVDNDQAKLSQLKAGKSPIFEPGLEEMIKRNMKSGRLVFTDNIKTAVQQSEIIFVCVNTPPKPDGQADLRYVEAVSREIAEHINGEYKVIVDKSTVPVKTAEKVKEIIMKYSQDKTKFDVVSNPEFLREGSAVQDTLEPDRIVLGVDSEQAKAKMLELYQPIIDATNVPVKITSIRSAELIKHAANTFLATKISFANLVAETCEKVGADALEVLEAVGLDERIGKQFLKPGIGFGGSCFPKDIAAYKKTLESLGVNNSLIKAVEDINLQARQRFTSNIEKELATLTSKKIAVLGLAFKPNTDDIRNSPAVEIIKTLAKSGAKITVYDPVAMENVKKDHPDLLVKYAASALEAVQGSEILILCTEWDEFKNLDLAEVKQKMATPIIFDGRNAFSKELAEKLGFKYHGVGR